MNARIFDVRIRISRSTFDRRGRAVKHEVVQQNAPLFCSDGDDVENGRWAEACERVRGGEVRLESRERIQSLACVVVE